MRKYFLFFLIIAFSYTLDCNSQNIDNIRGTSWISLDYVRDMENYLPCECFDSTNYCCYISIAQKLNRDSIDEEEQNIPDGILNYIVQTEHRLFHIIAEDSDKYIIEGEDGNWNSKTFELILTKGDTLLLVDGISSSKFIKSAIPFDFWESKNPVNLENIALFNKSLSLRGYPTIQEILKEDSLRMDCNAWLGNRNMIYSPNTKKSWVLEINNSFLYIEKVINYHDPIDPIKTKVIQKLRWVTNGKERLPRKQPYPIWSNHK